MRYLVAMLFALAGAALASVFLGQPVANWLIGRLTFDSPDSADIDQIIFLAVGFVGMVLGWALGWALAARLGEADEAK